MTSRSLLIAVSLVGICSALCITGASFLRRGPGPDPSAHGRAVAARIAQIRSAIVVIGEDGRPLDAELSMQAVDGFRERLRDSELLDSHPRDSDPRDSDPRRGDEEPGDASETDRRPLKIHRVLSHASREDARRIARESGADAILRITLETLAIKQYTPATNEALGRVIYDHEGQFSIETVGDGAAAEKLNHTVGFTGTNNRGFSAEKLPEDHESTRKLLARMWGAELLGYIERSTHELRPDAR